MHDYYPEISSNSISEDLFCKIFLWGALMNPPDPLALACLCFAQQLVFTGMTTHHPTEILYTHSSVASWPDH